MNPIIELWVPQTKMCGSHLMWVPHEYLWSPRGSRTGVPHKQYSWTVDDMSHQWDLNARLLVLEFSGDFVFQLLRSEAWHSLWFYDPRGEPKARINGQAFVALPLMGFCSGLFSEHARLWDDRELLVFSFLHYRELLVDDTLKYRLVVQLWHADKSHWDRRGWRASWITAKRPHEGPIWPVLFFLLYVYYLLFFNA
jgi:hypothetical protein